MRLAFQDVHLPTSRSSAPVWEPKSPPLGTDTRLKVSCLSVGCSSPNPKGTHQTPAGNPPLSKYCGAMALPAAWPFDVPICRGMAVVGALVLLPMPMSTKCEMLNYLRMPTHAYAPGTVRKPTIKQGRANCDPHVLTLM
jgi:hypothetical protein